MTKKTILFLITQQELGGAQQYILQLAKFFKKNNKVIVAFSKEKKGSSTLSQKLTEENINFIELKHLKREICPIKDILSIVEIKKLIRKINPKIIHLNSSKISILGTIAKCLSFKKTKTIYTVHGWVFNEPMSKTKKSFYYNLEKLSARKKNKLICVSKYDQQIAIKNNVCDDNKLITIHNGLSDTNFISKEEALKKLGISNDNNDFIIGSIGNLYDTKGFTYLIDAASELKKKDLKFKLLIIGNGDNKEILKQKINDQELKENVFIIDTISENAKTYLKAFDIYVCSSVKEGLPYSIIEAMQAKLPIVATSVGGNSELIENNKTGLLIKSKSGEAIAEAILKLINNEGLSSKLARDAREKALQEFSINKMLKSTEEVYDSLLK